MLMNIENIYNLVRIFREQATMTPNFGIFKFLNNCTCRPPTPLSILGNKLQ